MSLDRDNARETLDLMRLFLRRSKETARASDRFTAAWCMLVGALQYEAQVTDAEVADLMPSAEDWGVRQARIDVGRALDRIDTVIRGVHEGHFESLAFCRTHYQAVHWFAEAGSDVGLLSAAHTKAALDGTKIEARAS